MDPLDNLSDADLEALSRHDLDAMSDAGLAVVAQMKDAPANTPAQPKAQEAGIGDTLLGIGKYGPMGAFPEARQFAQDATDAFFNRPQRPDAGAIPSFLGRNAGPIAAGFIAPEGVAAGALAAGVGSLAQSAFRAGASKLDNTIPEVSPNEALRGAAGQTLGAGAAGATLKGLGMAYQAVKPGLVKAGAQGLRILNGIPTKFGEAVLRDPDILARAPTDEGVNQAYQAFEQASGLVSPRLKRALSGELVQGDGAALAAVQSAAKLLTPYIDQNATATAGKVVYDTARLQAAKAAGTLAPELEQALYDASQGAAHLQKMAKAGSPKEIANFANIGSAKSAFDDILEVLTPGYKNARTAAFENAAKEQFGSVFPLNANQSPNALRGYASLLGAGQAPFVAAMTGSAAPLAAVGLPFVQSPLMAQGAIRATNALAPAAKEVMKRGGTILLGSVGNQAASASK